MTRPFEPAGDQARWRIIMDLLTDLEPGDVLTYERAADALGLHERVDRAAIQAAVRRAAAEHERVNRRVLTPVPGKGYRVVHAAEQSGIAKKYQRRSLVAIRQGASKVENVRLDELDQPQRNEFAAISVAFSRQAQAIRMLDVRQRNLEDALAVTAQKADRTADGLSDFKERTGEEVAELRARLAALEATQARETP